jgi:hypothetical protein
MPTDPKALLEKLQTPAKTIDLNKIDEEEIRLETAST